MQERVVRARAFATPLTNPALPRGSYRFEEYLIITYRTDPQKLRELVLEPLQLREPLVRFEFIRMPNSSGFGDCTESGQVIPVSFKGRKGSYNHCMFLNDHPPIAGGRELWDFPKKLATPTLRTEIDTLFGTLNFGSIHRTWANQKLISNARSRGLSCWRHAERDLTVGIRYGRIG